MKAAADDEERITRGRKRSVVEEAAAKIAQKTEVKRRISIVSAEAAERGKEHVESSHRDRNQRRLSTAISDAVETVSHRADDHDDAVKHSDCGSAHPEWQKEARGRTSSLAMDAATWVEEKGAQKERMSVAGEQAAKMAIFRGSAVH